MWNLRKLVCGEIRSIIEINKIVRDPKRGLLHLFAEAFSLSYIMMSMTSLCCSGPLPEEAPSVEDTFRMVMPNRQFQLLLLNEKIL